MCKLKGHGKRCPETPQRKEAESYRQKVKYRAKKEGMSSLEWLGTQEGLSFKENNDPRIINPNWEKEHRESLAKMKHENHPPVTMKNNFLATAEDMNTIKSSFLNIKEVRGKSDLNQLNQPEYMDWVKKSTLDLKREEVSAISIYTGGSYNTINGILRYDYKDQDAEKYARNFYHTKNIDDAHPKDAKFRETIEKIDAALSKRRENAEVTFRCMTIQGTIEDALEKYSTNSLVKFDNYVSTSHDPRISINFSGQYQNYEETDIPHDEKNEYTYTADVYGGEYASCDIMFEVHSNAGQPIAYLSKFDNEREVLLPRGMNFKVVNARAATPDSAYKFYNRDKEKNGVIGKNFVIVQIAECDDEGNLVSPRATADYHPPALPKSPLSRE